MSGSPVYVSDKPGEQDFELLRRLVLSDGRALRPLDVGVSTRDSLFVDPTSEPALFKAVNRKAARKRATRALLLLGSPRRQRELVSRE